jgi:peptide/nickel transport system ATP-binding protein
MLIEALKIHKSFPSEEGQLQGKSILRGVCIAIDEGESAAIVGPSGCGKTTLALILTGLMPCDRGSVSFRGKPAWSGQRKQIAATHRQIQLVSQHPETAFDPLWPMERSLMEALVLGGLPWPPATLEATLERFQLSPLLLRRLPQQLSGGELQRFALIRALSLDPAVLVLDEPTAMLDAVTQAQIMDLLREYGTGRGIACLLISHNLHLVRHFCGKAWELREGLAIPLRLNNEKKRECEE